MAFYPFQIVHPVLYEVEATDFSNALKKAIRLDQFLNSNDIIDLQSAEFNINYDNRIEIENINVDTECITSELYDILDEEFVASVTEVKTINAVVVKPIAINV